MSMARSTIADDIMRLEESLTIVRTQIEKHQSFRKIEEGSSSSRFSTEFTDVATLYAEERKISAQLETLYSYQARL